MRTVLVSLCLLVLAVSSFAAPIQWTVADGGNGHWYEYMPPVYLNWDQAKAAAEASIWQGERGYLATITSAEENAWITANIWTPIAPLPTRIWLGGYQDRSASDYSEPEGGWRWVTGETWSYTNWHTNEPNNGVYGNTHQEYEEDWLTAVGVWAFTWNDITYTAGFSPSELAPSGYLVEYAPVPEPSTILALTLALTTLTGTLVRKRRA